ncbi:MAG: GNAT family N-acetyltransferase [Bacteroidota bacterium]
MDYEFQRLSKENIGDVARIHKSVYNREIPLSDLRKKYDTRYLGIEYCCYLAYFKGDPVAFYGLIPVVSHWGTITEISGHLLDFMTVNAHRGRGLFGMLATKSHELARELGITFVWGFGTDVSARALIVKMNFNCDEHVHGYRFFARKRGLDKLFGKTPFLRSLSENRTRRILQQYVTDKLFQGSLYTLPDPVIMRNADYFRYKSFSSAFFIELEEVLFWIKLHPHHGIMIGDIEATSEEQLRKGISAFKELADRHGLGTLVFQTAPETPAEKVIAELADETFLSWKLCYQSISSKFPLEKLKVTWGDLDTF